MTIQFEKLKARLLANPKVKAEYDTLAPEFEIAAELLRARLRAGLSQAELAARMGTSQSTIARLENGYTLPSTKTLLRYAKATGSSFTCGYRRREERQPTTSLRGATRRSNPFFRGAMDCFAEPVIGRAFARPVGSQ